MLVAPIGIAELSTSKFVFDSNIPLRRISYISRANSMEELIPQSRGLAIPLHLRHCFVQHPGDGAIVQIPSAHARFAHYLNASRVCKVLAQVFEGCAEFLGKATSNSERAAYPEILHKMHGTASTVRNFGGWASCGHARKQCFQPWARSGQAIE